LLSFCPKILQNENAKMREIVDKHFPDNWVLPIYQGHLVDLTEFWKTYNAAMKALNNNIVPDNIKKIAGYHFKKLDDCLHRLDKYIIEGQLQEEFVLDHVKELMNCLRDSNVTIRWIMLHKNCKDKKLKEIVENMPN
jgi:WASH complex subunit strumpellin